jgi:hypothetical protein
MSLDGFFKENDETEKLKYGTFVHKQKAMRFWPHRFDGGKGKSKP